MPRQPGSLVRAKCCVCGTVELATSGGSFSRCVGCKSAGRHGPHARRAYYDITGKEGAGAEVQRAVREGRLQRASTMACADCGCAACDYDHRNYNFPIEVAPVCRGCNLRRGPAIPKQGWLGRALRHGFPPYRLRCRAVRVFALLGLDATVLDGMPKRLELSHWEQLRDTLPELAEAKAGA